MLYKLLADCVVLCHFLWILFLIFGGIWGRRRRWVRFVHVPALFFAFFIEISDWYCPLTHLEVWLRVTGCDVEYFPEVGDAELVERGERSGRLILTRDTLLVRRRKARNNCFLVEGDHFRDQLRQVVRAFDLEPFGGFLTRCLECNALLHGIDRESAESRVPPYVFATHGIFRECASCGRLYWGGTHRERMEDELRTILGLTRDEGPGTGDWVLPVVR